MYLFKTIRWAAVCSLILLLQGCASYFSHYGSFESRNSAGADRRFVVSWQTAEYPDWFWSENTSTAIELETQCSTRKLYFSDASMNDGASCREGGAGIITCGDPALDLDLNGRAVVGDQQVCGSVSNAAGVTKITDLGRELLIKIDCWPASVEYEIGGEKKNRDYLKHSIVPYTIAIKKVPRYSLDDRVPVLGEKICKEK